MTSQSEPKTPEEFEIELSPWWGAATFALFVAGGAFLIARSQGPDAVEILFQSTSMILFLTGGVLVGLLFMQALGASQRWEFSEQNEVIEANTTSTRHPDLPVHESSTGQATTTQNNEDVVDPFYEILKRNKTDKRAA